jgi:hypothetical protein
VGNPSWWLSGTTAHARLSLWRIGPPKGPGRPTQSCVGEANQNSAHFRLDCPDFQGESILSEWESLFTIHLSYKPEFCLLSFPSLTLCLDSLRLENHEYSNKHIAHNGSTKTKNCQFRLGSHSLIHLSGGPPQLAIIRKARLG